MTRVLVTGGSGGIGGALVERLRAARHEVVFTYIRNADRARSLAEATGARALLYDQTRRDSVSALAQEVAGSAFDALVHAAAWPAARAPFLKTDPDELVAYVSASLDGVIRLSQAFTESCRRREVPGAIVLVLSSVVLGTAPEKQTAYVIAKHALLGLARSMAAELIRYDVRVNAVSPGMTRTSFNASLPDRFIELYEDSLPMKRIALPEEVAGVIQFLLSPEASYLSAANIPVTGGREC